MSEYKPIVMTKDGVYARDEGLITYDTSQPGVPQPIFKKKKDDKNLITRDTQLPAQESSEQEVASRFDCIHKPKA